MRILWLEKSIEITHGKLRAVFCRESGALEKTELNGEGLSFESLLADAGVDERSLRGQMVYDPLEDKRTWELHRIEAVDSPDKAEFLGFREEDGCLVALYAAEGMQVEQMYDVVGSALRLRVRLTSGADRRTAVNGVHFLLSRKKQGDLIDFPTNVPAQIFEDTRQTDGTALSCGLVGSMTHIQSGDTHFNLLFLDETEKWSQGFYTASGCVHHVFAASVESWLNPGESLEVGSLYLSPVEKGKDPYLAIREFFEALGFRAARGGLNEGLLYSCHPFGTMDGRFERQKDLWEFAKELPEIAALGVRHIWLLPVFDHLERGVYHPADQRPIDARYGGEEAMKHFADEAHRLGMTVLFDYVPHGPEPTDPLGMQHLDWCSTRKDGSLQDEWHCVSFDMTNPEYIAYTEELVSSHVRRFNIDGARIDCAMGGLSNWSPWPGHRPSASNLMGGVAISRAIKDGFEKMGKKAFILPENFNPVPAYYPVTDVFYGMNLYRVMTDLWQRGVDSAAFACELTRFLDIEHRAMPEDLKKLRFLGNHDTVSWVWQCRRAYESYGVERARALFALMYFIDGVPMLYQGDEDPAIAGKSGPVLREYLSELARVRSSLIGEGTDIRYEKPQCGVMLFHRLHEGRERTVCINLSEKEEKINLPLSGKKLLAGSAQLREEGMTLPPCAYAILG